MEQVSSNINQEMQIWKGRPYRNPFGHLKMTPVGSGMGLNLSIAWCHGWCLSFFGCHQNDAILTHNHTTNSPMSLCTVKIIHWNCGRCCPHQSHCFSHQCRRHSWQRRHYWRQRRHRWHRKLLLQSLLLITFSAKWLRYFFHGFRHKSASSQTNPCLARKRRKVLGPRQSHHHHTGQHCSMWGK